MFVISSYEDEYISPNSGKLMVHKELRKKYDEAVGKVTLAKEQLFSKIREILGNDCDVTAIFSDILKCDELDILEVLSKWVKEGLLKEERLFIDFTSVKYLDIFNTGVEKFLSDSKNIDKIKEYSERYDELISQSPVFKRGVFSHYNAESITESLNNNGFFGELHKVHLNGIEQDIESSDDLKNIIQDERNKIFSDEKLKKKFDKIDTELGKRALLQLKLFGEICIYCPPQIKEL